jgi:hypothetical protein
MKFIIYILATALFIECSSYEKIGDFEYKIGTKRINSGDFDALIFKHKVYIHKNSDTIFAQLLKAKKLDYETEKDTVFAYGKMLVKSEKDKTIIITKEININGYENFTKNDSVIRIYEQLKDGNVKLLKYTTFQFGKVKYEYISK